MHFYVPSKATKPNEADLETTHDYVVRAEKAIVQRKKLSNVFMLIMCALHFTTARDDSFSA